MFFKTIVSTPELLYKLVDIISCIVTTFKSYYTNMKIIDIV